MDWANRLFRKSSKPPAPTYAVEHMGRSCGACDCCGATSHSVWGMIHAAGCTVAAYFVRWAEGHLDNPGASFDLVLGDWGKSATDADRYVVSLLYREIDGIPQFMVVNAADCLAAQGALAKTALSREEVIGTPLAPQIFALVDAVCEQDKNALTPR